MSTPLKIYRRVDLERLLAIALMLLTLSGLSRSFWIDEAGMIAELRQSFHLTFRDYTRIFPMFSLYEAYMWLHCRIWGYSELTTRLPSAVAGSLTLYNLLRCVRIVNPGTSTVIPSAILLAMEPITGFFTSARPYAFTLAALSFALKYWFKWIQTLNTTEESSEKRTSAQVAQKNHAFWWRFCFWSALASCLKIFAFELPAILLIASLFVDTPAKPRDWYKKLLGILFVCTPLIAQLPIVLHFQSRASLHSYAGKLDPNWIWSFLVFSIAPPICLVAASAATLIGAVSNAKPKKKDKTQPWILTTMGAVTLIVPLIHFLYYTLTGAFVVHSNYIVSAFLPAAVFWSTIIWRCLPNLSWRNFFSGFFFLATTFQILTAPPPRKIGVALSIWSIQERIQEINLSWFNRDFTKMHTLSCSNTLYYPAL